jgi:protein-S-isoprenylcysteine O-methyltransferase Ste14
MKNVINHILSFILPITVLVIVPLYLENNLSVKHMPALVIGIIIMLIGLYVMTITFSAFIRIGKGTLAPWSPTKKLIVSGIYRYVRNPMIMGVFTVLIGESICILSSRIFFWAILFFIINTIYFVLYEEPNLEKKFGSEYLEYKRNVPRWLPRKKPYKPS